MTIADINPAAHYTLADYAAVFGLSESTARRHRKAGFIRCVRIGGAVRVSGRGDSAGGQGRSAGTGAEAEPEAKGETGDGTDQRIGLETIESGRARPGAVRYVVAAGHGGARQGTAWCVMAATEADMFAGA